MDNDDYTHFSFLDRQRKLEERKQAAAWKYCKDLRVQWLRAQFRRKYVDRSVSIEYILSPEWLTTVHRLRLHHGQQFINDNVQLPTPAITWAYWDLPDSELSKLPRWAI